MAMLFGKVTVPDTSSDMSVKAIPIVSLSSPPVPGSITFTNGTGETREIATGYTTMIGIGGTVWIYAKPEANPDDNTTWPTAAFVVANGTPSTETLPYYIQDPWGSPSFPDLRKYFVAKTGSGTGDLRVGN